MDKGYKIALILVCLLLVELAVKISTSRTEVSGDTADTLPARPQSTALNIEGFGRNTVGGAGGTLYTVTTLSDSGPCSLRDLLNRPGPRIIKFAVSGTIDLQSPLSVAEPFLTIDGSDAPNGGICLRNSVLSINANNVIVRYLRIRPGELGTTDVDAVQIYNCSDVVIDHCSLSWGDDENLDLAARNVTIQWCIISENLGTGAVLMNYGTNPTTTLHHNLFASNAGTRLPEMGVGDLDLVNNVFYNYYNYGNTRFSPGCNACGGGGPIHTNIVGNYYKPGSQSAVPPSYSREIRLDGADPVLAGQSSIYVEGNISPNRPNDNLPQMVNVWLDSGGLTTLPSRHNFPAVKTTSADQAYLDVLANAGATLPCLDAVDRRILTNVKKGKGGVIREPSEIGGWPGLGEPCQ